MDRRQRCAHCIVAAATPVSLTIIRTCSVGSLFMGETVMLKGCMIAGFALLFLMLCDRQVSNGKYTHAVTVIAKQITRSFGV
ncbi:hypothetical protein ABIF90_008137 [Bradyrhizobium japonicum]